MRSEKQTVLITGCAPGGIGHALAEDFSSRGFRVFATARKVDQLTELEAKGIETLALDVTSASSVEAAKADIEGRAGGRLDFLVNNAGRNYTVPALDVDLDEVQSTFDTNLFGVMRMCQAFAPLLIESKGTIVQIGSFAGIMPYVFGATYNASKAALHAYSNTLRLELAPFDVKVVTIVTGGVQSRIARTERSLPEGSLYTPINDAYQSRLTHSQRNAMPTVDYARSVVNQVTKSRPPRWVFEGGKSWLMWFLDTYAPRSVWDWIFPRMFGLNRLRKPAMAQKKES
ncbi:MAG: hypothetical protein M1833_005579 [Piccolia ochrophora]|nr:MAG: hypothetical protein M1833_005579 [Piccolia ochrophora]